MDHVAIFLAGWPLQIHEALLARALVAQGHAVDLFLVSCDSFVDIEALAQAGVIIHDCDRLDRLPPSVQRFRARAERALWSRAVYPLVPPRAVAHARRVLRETSFRCLIGVEKRGLIWAARAGAELGIPVVYHSLELYTWEHPSTRRSLGAILTKLAERRRHKQCLATIIQDPDRADALFSDNGVSGGRRLYMPISLPGPARRERSEFLHRRLGIPSDQRIALSFGLVAGQRLSPEIARQADRLPPGWVLVMHGFGKPRDIEEVRRCGGDRLILSLGLVHDDQIDQLVASADAGLVLYRDRPLNDRLTSRSSEKLALYLKCGVPIVAFSYPGFRTLIDQWDCGRTIDRVGELPEALDEIGRRREPLRANSWRCFEQNFDFASNVKPVLEFIGALDRPSNPPSVPGALRRSC